MDYLRSEYFLVPTLDFLFQYLSDVVSNSTQKFVYYGWHGSFHDIEYSVNASK